MAVDYFLKIEPNVTGEAMDHAHHDEIDILAWSWGMSQSGSMHIAGGGGSGKVNVNDLVVTKWVDKSTSPIMQKCCDGTHFDKATLVCRKAGQTPLEYLKIEMFEVMITSMQTGGATGDDRVTETTTLNFSKVNVIYTPQNADGTGAASIPIGWDIKANTAM